MADRCRSEALEAVGQLPLSTIAKRTWQSLFDLAGRASPDCPSCAGVGWTTKRSQHGIAGLEAVACHCTMEVGRA